MKFLSKLFCFAAIVTFAVNVLAEPVLQNAVIPGAFVFFSADNTAMKGTLIDTVSKKYCKDTCFANSLIDDDELKEFFKTNLPAEIKDNLKIIASINPDPSNFNLEADFDLETIDFIIGLAAPADMRPFMQAVKLECEKDNDCVVKAVNIAGLAGFEIADKDDPAERFQAVCTSNGRLIFIGKEATLKKQLAAAPAAVPADGIPAGSQTFLRFTLPAKVIADLANEAATTEDPNLKLAIASLRSVDLAFKADAAAISVALIGGFASADDAMKVNSNLLQPQLVPMMQGMLPMFVGGADLPCLSTLSTAANGKYAQLSLKLTETDIANLKPVIEGLINSDDADLD